MNALALCVALVAPVAIVASLLSRTIRSERREHSRERALLVNQILHLSGRTWTPPPTNEPRPVPEPSPLVWAPEQYPDGQLED